MHNVVDSGPIQMSMLLRLGLDGPPGLHPSIDYLLPQRRFSPFSKVGHMTS